MWAPALCLRARPHVCLQVMGRRRAAPAPPIPSPALPPAAPSPLALDRTGTRVLITIAARPGANLSAVTDFSPESVGVAVAAPPVDGEANTQLVKYLSRVLGVRKADLSLQAGARSRHKLLAVGGGLSLDQVEHRLRAELDQTS